MVGALLLRGMLIGVVAGILGFAFFKVVGEPSVDRAIAFEAQMDAAKDKAMKDEPVAKGLPAPAEAHEPELVSRPGQAAARLSPGVLVYAAAVRGLLERALALAHRPLGDFGP